MKNMLLSVSILLLTLKSFGQTGTKIHSDSLITIPKSVAIWILQDIAQGDACLEELNLLNTQLQYKDTILYNQDSIIYYLNNQLALKDSIITNLNQVTGIREEQIEDCTKEKKQLKFANTMWKIAAFTLPILTAILIAQ